MWPDTPVPLPGPLGLVFFSLFSFGLKQSFFNELAYLPLESTNCKGQTEEKLSQTFTEGFLPQ